MHLFSWLAGHTTSNGGFLSVSGATLTLVGVDFRNNTADVAVIACRCFVAPWISSLTRRTYAMQGGSIFAGTTAKLNMTRVSFAGGSGIGGAIALRGFAEASITDVHAENNLAHMVRFLPPKLGCLCELTGLSPLRSFNCDRETASSEAPS